MGSDDHHDVPPEASSLGSHRFLARVDLPVSIEQAFAYHERPGCLDRLIPPWDRVRVEHRDGGLQVGSRVVLKTGLFGIPLRWRARHVAYEPPTLFADVQDSGPFAAWHHRHHFIRTGRQTSRLTDDISYQLPLGSLGGLFGSSIARGKIETMFAYRHRVTRDDLSLMARYASEPLVIGISGATGLVGSGLCQLLGLLGHRTLRMVRGESAGDDEIAAWGSDEQFAKFEGVDAVVHLAGKPIADGRWSEQTKQEIRDSRVVKTRQLCERLAKLQRPPRTLICAAATGIYGDRGDELLSETSAPGDDFLADVSQEWEAACEPASAAGIRVVNTRFGIVLTPTGGALRKMLLPAKLGGAWLGSGRQYWSWIALDDVLGGIVHAIHTESLRGPVNFVSPTPMTNREFAKTLGNVLRRPALVPAPALALRLGLGELADALLLSSSRVVPDRLLASGYEFRFASLVEVLRYCLGKERVESEA